MLNSVQDFHKYAVVSSDGANCGRVKDLYFDDQGWTIKYVLVALEPRRFGQKQIVIVPEEIRAFDAAAGELELAVPAGEVAGLRLASSVLPVCKQYASMALGSPGGSRYASALNGVDPHLRSARTVINYGLNLAGEPAGRLSDLIWEDETWEIRFLAVEQVIDARALHFHILPQTVERITWATQRVLLRELNPVQLAGHEAMLEKFIEQFARNAA